MKIRIQQNSALHEKGGRFKNEDFVYPILDNAQLDSTVTESIPNIPGLYMICDGVGGDERGEVAAQLAVSQFAKYFDTFPPSGQVTYGYLSAALIRVEEAFSNYLKTYPESRGMGSTLSLLYLDDHGAMMAWIGDSRVYHFRNGEILYKTRDHSLVNDLIEQGEITEAAARYHPRRNVVLRVIKGTEEATDLDVQFIPVAEIEDGDFFFICSDGVLEEVNDKELQTLFSGEFNAEDIRQEIYSLCKGNSNDNFSAYVIQLGDVNKEGVADTAQETIAAASVIEDDDDILVVDEVEEPPMEVELEEEAAIFNPKAEAPIAASGSVLDQLGKLHVTESEDEPVAEIEEPTISDPPQTQTVFDRLNKHAKTEEMNNEEDNREKKQEGPAFIPPPPTHMEEKEERNPVILPAILVSVVFISLIAVIWLFQSNGNFSLFTDSNAWKTSFQQYVADGKADLDAGKYQNAIQLADSAMKLAEAQNSEGEVAEAQNLKSAAEQKIQELRENKLISLQAMAQVEMGEGKKYPGNWRAREYFKEIQLNYGDLLDSLDVMELGKKINACKEGMASYSPAQSFNQLLAKGQELCNEGSKGEAELFFTEAQSFANQIQKDDILLAEVSKCMERPIAQANTDQGPEAESAEGTNPETLADANTTDDTAEGTTASRGIQPADANARVAKPTADNSTTTADNATPTTDNAAADNATPIADNTASQRTADDNNSVTEESPAIASIGDPNADKASSGSFLGETAVPVGATQMRGASNARMSGSGLSIEAQQKSLENGKKLFHKSQKSNSAFEANRAIEYIEQAGPAADGEAFYMLAVLYNQPGAAQDKEQAITYAELSKKNEYTGGYYLYGVYLLNTKNSVDSSNAVKAIQIAAQRGYQPAVDKLKELGS